MRKSVLTVTSAAFLLGGLTGCGGGNSAADNRYYEETSPMGYYTSEHNPNVNNDRNRPATQEERGNARIMDDNDGPLNEIMDRAVVYGERRNNDNNNRNTASPATNRGKQYDHERLYSRSDKNYHGQLDGVRNIANPSYYNNYNGRLTEKLADRASKVNGVENARAVSYGDDILIAVEPNNDVNEQQLSRDIRRAVKPLVNGKDCRVVVDDGTFNTVRQLDNDLRGGGPVNDINSEIKDLINTMVPGR